MWQKLIIGSSSARSTKLVCPDWPSLSDINCFISRTECLADTPASLQFILIAIFCLIVGGPEETGAFETVKEEPSVQDPLQIETPSEAKREPADPGTSRSSSPNTGRYRSHGCQW